MKKIALLFPGQGSQVPGMGKAFYEIFSEAREIVDAADREMKGIKNAIFNGSQEDLKYSSVTQPAIFIASCAAFQVFNARFPSLKSRTAAVAGHSLGEYSALFSADVFDFQTGLKLVEYRGQNLEQACRNSPGGMAAILGMDRDQLGNLCREASSGGEVCEMVNFNCPGQIVTAGTKRGLSALASSVSSVPGAKAIPLNVSGPFHSSLLSEAAKKMEEKLAATPLNEARVQVFSNCDAAPAQDAGRLRKNLVTQIDHPVYWEDSVRAMMAQGIETFVEVGPGKVLTGLLRKIDRKMIAFNVEDPDSLNKALEGLESLETNKV